MQLLRAVNRRHQTHAGLSVSDRAMPATSMSVPPSVYGLLQPAQHQHQRSRENDDHLITTRRLMLLRQEVVVPVHRCTGCGMTASATPSKTDILRASGEMRQDTRAHFTGMALPTAAGQAQETCLSNSSSATLSSGQCSASNRPRMREVETDAGMGGGGLVGPGDGRTARGTVKNVVETQNQQQTESIKELIRAEVMKVSGHIKHPRDTR